MIKKAFIIVLLVFVANVSFAQNQHIYCLRVNQDGSTTITFEPCSSVGFSKAIISSYNEGTNLFYQIGELTDVSQNQYTDNTLDANTHSVRFRVTKNVLNDSDSSYYASTLFLVAQEIAPSVIRLTWNDARTGYYGSENEQYHIYRRFALSDTVWRKQGESNIGGFIDSLPPLCSDTAYYKIEIDNTNGCSSLSNEVKMYVSDDQIPLEPAPLSISVDNETQKIHFSWLRSLSSDTWGYVVCSGEPCIALDTLWGRDNTDYLCNSCSVTNVNSLAVMAFDSCFNTSLRSDNHKNIVLSADWKACSETITLNWTRYVGREVLGYNVYVSKNSSAFSLYNSFSSETTTCVFTVSSPIMNNDSYVFYIEAILQDEIKSFSNKMKCDFNSPPKVKYAYIRSAQVSEDNKRVKLSFFVDTSIVVSHYDLYRAKQGSALSKVATIPYQSLQSFTYTDILPQSADKTEYIYQLQVPDECDLYYSLSNTLSTICLHLQTNGDIANLSWNAPEAWTEINSYSVYRTQGATEVFLDNIFTGQTTYTDELTNSNHALSEVSYYVVANEQNPYPDSVQAHNYSSRAQIKSSTLFWIANAFTPLENTNNIFKPSLLYIKEGSYRFTILNRWEKQSLQQQTLLKVGMDMIMEKCCLLEHTYTLLNILTLMVSNKREVEQSILCIKTRRERKSKNYFFSFFFYFCAIALTRRPSSLREGTTGQLSRVKEYSKTSSKPLFFSL